MISSVSSTGLQDNYFPPIENLYFSYNLLLFMSKLEGLKYPSFTLTYAVEVIVIFLLWLGVQMLIVSLPIFISFL